MGVRKTTRLSIWLPPVASGLELPHTVDIWLDIGRSRPRADFRPAADILTLRICCHDQTVQLRDLQ